MKNRLFMFVLLLVTASFALAFTGCDTGPSGCNTDSNTDPNSNWEPQPQCNSTLPSGKTTRRINADGRNRDYILYVPRSYQGSSRVPLMVDLHPLFMTSEFQYNNSGTKQLADREGFIVVYPSGINNSWNFGPCCTQSRSVDDIGFVRTIVEEIKKEGCIDISRIYATGYSNGGGLSHYLACQASDMFAAVAPAAFDLVSEVTCTPSRPVSVYMARGQRDMIVPYNGGRSVPPTPYRLDPIHFLGAEGSFEEWSNINKCQGGPTNIGNNCQAYRNCAEGTEVVLCTKPMGSHEGWDAEQAWNFLKSKTMP